MEDLNKKYILTAGINHQTEAKFMENVNGKILGLEQNASLVPAGLDPPVTEGRTKFILITKYMDVRTELENKLKAINEKIAVEKKDISNMVVTNWMPVLQVSLDGSIENAKLLGYGVKGVGLEPSEVSVTNSNPVLDKIVIGYLTHTLHFVNSTTKSTAVPDDGMSIEVYERFGTVQPKSISEMTHIGKANRGIITNHFTEDHKDQTVWYAFVYSAKKEGVIPQQTDMKSATVA